MLNERELTKAELEKREDAIMDLKANKRSFVKRYGKDAEKVMYGRATNIAKKQTENMNKEKIRELIMASLQGPVSEKKGKDVDGDGDVDSQDYLAARDAAIKNAKKEKVDEMDINDPVVMKFRAAQDKLAKMRAANAGDDGNDKFFDAAKLRALKAKRAEIMRDMEQEAELEGGPIADKYGDMLNAIDAEMAKEKTMMGLEEGTELYNNNGFYFKRFYGGKENGPSLQITTDAGDFITIPGGKLGLFMSGLEKAVSVFDDMSRQLPIDEDIDLGHEDNEPHMIKAELYRIGKYAMELYAMAEEAEEMGGEVDFPAWWQAKITTAMNNMVSAKHYLDFETKEPAIDALVDKISGEEPHTEEPVNEGTWAIGTSGQIKMVLDLLDRVMAVKDSQELISMLEKADDLLYNAVGDDRFHDAIDGAKREAEEGNMDRVQNRLSDAYSRAEYFLEYVMDREGLKEEEAGEVDKVASDIQKAMNKHKGDESKTYQLQQARKAMNKGDLDKAKKIAARLAEKLKAN